MKKMVKICDKEYFMQASAYTQFAYKDETGRSFLQDLQSLIKLTKYKSTKNIEKINMSDFDNLTTLLLKISYVMIKEADASQVEDYVSFVKSIESLYDDETWINDVITLAATPISRQLQNFAK